MHLCLPAFAETGEYFDLGDGRVHLRRAGEVLHPERESRQTLDQTKLTINSYDFAAQYQQSPMPLEGGLIKWSWFRFYDRVPERQEGDLVTQSWDTAAKVGEINDFSVCTTWLRRGNDHYLIDVTRGRRQPRTRRLIHRRLGVLAHRRDFSAAHAHGQWSVRFVHEAVAAQVFRLERDGLVQVGLPVVR